MDIYKTLRVILTALCVMTSGLALAQVPSDAEISRTENANALGFPGSSDEVLQRMSKAAAYASEYRLKLTNDLFSKPIKTTLQSMTCLDKIMMIKFVGLGSFSFSSVINAIIQAAIQALIRAACSLVDQAFDSAMNTLTQMTRIDMGAGNSVSLVNVQGGAITVSPQISSSNPYVSQAMSAGMSAQPGQFGSPNLGAQPPQQSQSTWESFKNIFK